MGIYNSTFQKMDWPEELLEIFDDPLLADVRPKHSPKQVTFIAYSMSKVIILFTRAVLYVSSPPTNGCELVMGKKYEVSSLRRQILKFS